MQDIKPVLPVSQALHHGATELRSLKAQLEDLEHHLEYIFQIKKQRLDSRVLSSLQQFDLIIQSAEALAEFIDRISDSVELEEISICKASLVHAIRLEDLSNRLTGSNSKPTTRIPPEVF